MIIEQYLCKKNSASWVLGRDNLLKGMFGRDWWGLGPGVWGTHLSSLPLPHRYWSICWAVHNYHSSQHSMWREIFTRLPESTRLEIARHSWVLECTMVGNTMWNNCPLPYHNWTGCAWHSEPWLDGRSGKHFCCPAPAQTFPLSDRERRGRIFWDHVSWTWALCSSVSGWQRWELKWKVCIYGSNGLCPETFIFSPFPALLRELAFPLAGLMAELMSVFQLQLEAVRVIQYQDPCFQAK